MVNSFSIESQKRKIQTGDGPAIMGILNITPDSFSDGGKYFSLEKALSHAEKLMAEGADILDIGGESTRPFSKPVSPEEEYNRVIPLIRALRKKSDIPISVDTRKSLVARAALEEGADIINDIHGFEDPEILSLCVEFRAALVIMHMQGTPETMQLAPSYTEPVREVLSFLEKKMETAEKAGMDRKQIIVDPGIGFGKSVEDNLKLISAIPEFLKLGCPLLIGASRKRFIREILSQNDMADLLPASPEVISASIALALDAANKGAHILRVHDVAASRAALCLMKALHKT